MKNCSLVKYATSTPEQVINFSILITDEAQKNTDNISV